MKEQKQQIMDDQRTIADMNIEGMPWYIKRINNHGKQEEELVFTKKERKAIFLGVMSAIIPILLVYGGIFFILCLLMYLTWLN